MAVSADETRRKVTRLMRIGWETVGNILARVVAEKLDRDRLGGLELMDDERAVCDAGVMLVATLAGRLGWS